MPYLAEERPGVLARLSPKVNIKQTARMALGILIMYWGLVGALMGVLHSLIGVLVPASGPVSPNLVYSVVTAVAGLALGWYGARRLPLARRDVWVLSAIFIVLFAWTLPALAA